jgi:protein TonB
MRTNLLILLVLLISFLESSSQSYPPDCQQLHSGIFYYYSNEQSVYIREGNIQKEIVLTTGDTTVWQISWKNDCRYTMKFLYGQGAIQLTSKAWGDDIIVDVLIEKITPDYYIYRTFKNEKYHSVASKDTLWRKEQLAKANENSKKEAQFPGGLEEWNNYISTSFSKYDKELGKSKKEGICIVQFEVEEDGTVTNVKALSMKGSKIARYAVEVIKNSPKWIPGNQDGKPVKTVKVQPMTFVLIDEDRIKDL